MTDRVLLVGPQFRRRERVAPGDEDRVVPEAVGPARCPRERALENTFDELLSLPRHHPRGRTHELGPAAPIRDVGHLSEHQLQIGDVVTVAAGPPGGQHAGHAVERIHT